ncbi:hypothetical protein ACFE04_026277 [Oxalis oulophora]
MLPRKMNGLRSLKTLYLSYCSNLDKLPEDLRELECLEVLKASHTSVTHLPSMYCLINLVKLDLSYCERLMEIHPYVGTLRQLERLDLSNCINVASLPSDVHGWESLRILKLSGCSKLENLPDNMGEAKLLEKLNLSGSPLVDLPQFICQLTKLKILRLKGCKKLIFLPNFKGVSSLKKLDISCCNLPDGVIPNDLGSLTSLEILKLNNNDFISLPQSLQQLSRLHTLDLSSCKRFKDLSSSFSLNNLAVVCSSSSSLVPNLNEDDVRSSRSFDNTPPFVCHKRLFAREVPRYYLHAKGCVSLSLLTLSKIIIWCGTSTHLQLANCSRLADSEGCVSLSILKMFFQEHLDRVTKFSFTVPGNDYVNLWFHQRRRGSDMNIVDPYRHLETKMKLPRGLRKDTEWLGLVFCIVFTMNVQINPFEREVSWTFILNDGVILISRFRFVWDRKGLSNHHFIFFLSHEKLGNLDDKHIKISIAAKKRLMVVIKEIGMRVLYRKDVKELKYEMAEANQQNLGTQETHLEPGTSEQEHDALSSSNEKNDRASKRRRHVGTQDMPLSSFSRLSESELEPGTSGQEHDALSSNIFRALVKRTIKWEEEEENERDYI